jgi:hypothetical protein
VRAHHLFEKIIGSPNPDRCILCENVWRNYFRSRGEDFIYFGGQIEIETADSFCVVGVQVDYNFVVDVEPFRMVVHGFCDERDARHVAECGYEIFALKFAVEFIVYQTPTFGSAQAFGYFHVGQFLRAHEFSSSCSGWNETIMRALPGASNLEVRCVSSLSPRGDDYTPYCLGRASNRQLWDCVTGRIDLSLSFRLW